LTDETKLLPLMMMMMMMMRDEANVELSFTTDEQPGCWLLLFVVAKTHLRLVLITTSTTVTPE